ncbi:hypothetical protein [Effusibacillus lacus]|uniref:hypothetical protein n=1 Tax=Effusibacillus lacus TaxID=1348429 RepID=UPI0010D4FD78|nr:hypothetical protein [Effusibacillus lacus]TCS74982.1 hypothetical protein EDD64_110106 [Effusibacillus lacus]
MRVPFRTSVLLVAGILFFTGCSSSSGLKNSSPVPATNASNAQLANTTFTVTGMT